MNAPHPREVVELGAAGEAVREHHRVGTGCPDGREQAVLGDRHGHLVVALLDPEQCIQFKSGKCRKTCVEACGERHAINFEQKEEVKEIEVGTIILATGFRSFDPQRIPYYGYGQYPNVYTALEVERLVNASGPTDGEVVLRDGKAPGSVAIIHCVGSRDVGTNRWCSRVCCMYSLKLAHLLKEHTEAELCGSCHWWEPKGVPVFTEYADWKAGPAAAKGAPCQSCHMPKERAAIATGSPVRAGVPHHGLLGLATEADDGL